jgi:hypothetical protein
MYTFPPKNICGGGKHVVEGSTEALKKCCMNCNSIQTLPLGRDCWKFEKIPISRYKGLKGHKTWPVLEGHWPERAFSVRWPEVLIKVPNLRRSRKGLVTM